jgi:hypothetical protein
MFRPEIVVIERIVDQKERTKEREGQTKTEFASAFSKRSAQVRGGGHSFDDRNATYEGDDGALGEMERFNELAYECNVL